MKAIVYTRYGPPDVLEIRDVEKPVPKGNEVLIEVRAASVNPLDWHFVRGTPLIARMMTGLSKPRFPGLGVDVSGRVEAAGREVTDLRPGDEVFGAGKGAFAEYACARASDVATKPANATHEQAASVPVAAITALQALRDKARVQPGQKVLINGAAGGVGTFAVQIARTLGADVTGVCSTRNDEMVRSLGAGRVVDYTREDFTRIGERYDLIFDCIGNHPLSALRRALARDGMYLGIGGPSDRWFDPLPDLFGLLVTSLFTKPKLKVFLAKMRREDLIAMRELIEAGKVTPVIDRRYPLSEVREAIRYLEEGHARGKVVIVPDGEAK